MPGSKWVRMRHPNIDHSVAPDGTALRTAFDDVWSKNGWEIVGNADGPEILPDEDQSAERVAQAEAQRKLGTPSPGHPPVVAVKKEG